MKRATLAFACTLAAAAPARANMTIAAQAAGGLIPIRSEAITLEEEDLYVSPDLVRVHYVFRNISGKAVEAPILFPLPDMDTRLQSDDSYVIPLPYNAAPPLIPAQVKVNGKLVEVGWQHYAYTADGRDVTRQLTKAGLPMLAVGEVNDAARKNSDDLLRQLVEDGVLEKDKWGYHANWIVRGAYRWEQSFAAEGKTVVDLEYKPLTGGYSTSLKAHDKPTAAQVEASFSQRDSKPDYAPWPESYCLTPAQAKALRALPRHKNETDAEVRWTRYILVTARNWQGPIGRFHLTVDKQNPKAVAAFCAPDGKAVARKTGKTTTELTIRNFTPTANFQLLTVTPD
ncbi:MAG: DUF4424 family protein [Bacteroidales bacterium]